MFLYLLEKSFQHLAASSGGSYRAASSAEAAIAVVEDIARRVFGQLELDRKIYEMLKVQAGPQETQNNTLLDHSRAAASRPAAPSPAPSAMAPAAPAAYGAPAEAPPSEEEVIA